MTLELLKRADLRYYAPGFRIIINGQKLEADISKAILNLRVTERSNEVGDFSFVVNDEFNLRTQEFKWLDHPLFEVGNNITIEMGYAGNLQAMIDGKIKKLESSFLSEGAPTISVEGFDLAYDALVSQKSSPARTFDKAKYSEIAQTLASEAGLSTVVDETNEVHEKVNKESGVNYYNFLCRLAEKTGYEFFLVRKTLHFINRKVQQEEILTLAWGQNLISFNPSVNTTGLVTEVEVRGWDPVTKEEVVGHAAVGEEHIQEYGKKTGSEIAKELYGEAKKVIHDPKLTLEKAKEMAQAELDKASNKLLTATGSTFGIPEIRPGVTVRLERLGKRFSGKYYVTEATHTIDGSGYKTNFTAERNAI